MHSFLRAIGFSETFRTERDIEIFLDNLLHTYDDQEMLRDADNRVFIELKKSVGPDIGICVVGEMDGYGFHRMYYYPYLEGKGITSEQEISIEPRANGHGISAMSDDGRVGVSLIYWVNNPIETRKRCIFWKTENIVKNVTLSGLAKSGMILFPVQESASVSGGESREEYYKKHDALVRKAKNGNPEAIESLSLEDMDTYAMLSRRVMREDIFSIVDSFFMPAGMECDLYQIMGTIRFYRKVRNSVTKEDLYEMTLECNGMLFDVCINEKDLLGDPDTGRRFKGIVWMQGRLNFAEETA